MVNIAYWTLLKQQNCYNIFTIVRGVKYLYIKIKKNKNIILGLTTTKNKGIVEKEVLHLQYFSQHFYNKL